MSIPDDGGYQLVVGIKVGNADGSVSVLPTKYLQFAAGTSVVDMGGHVALITPPGGGGGGGDALTSNPLSQFATTTPTQLRTVMAGGITGTGDLVFADSPTFVTPNIGVATGSVSGTSGSTTGNAATVTTNANLTGHITSIGNAALLGSFTVAQLNAALSDGTIATGGGTATGTNTGDQTNIAGNAATVTTNANLTGHVTSVGNAALLGSFTVAQLNAALSDGTIATGGGTASGTNTGDQTTVSGNAGTATALETARTINGVSFDGTGNITVTAAAGTLTGTTLKSTVVASSLTSVGALTALVMAGTISAADNPVSRPYFDDIAEKVHAVSFSGTAEFDLENGNVQTMTITAAVTAPTLTNPPATGREGALTIYALQDGTGSWGWTWPASVKWPGGVAPTPSGANKMDIYWLSTHDAGTTWYGTSSLNH